MSKLINLLNKKIIIITLVGTFALGKTPIEIFEEVESDILTGFDIETVINYEKKVFNENKNLI